MGELQTKSDRLSALDGGGKTTLASAEAFAGRIVAEGAIMTMPGSPVARYLVGCFVWLAPDRVFWFTAYGDAQSDGHLLEFDDAQPIEGGGVSFARDGTIVGQLTPIDRSGVDDPDDYRIAWQLWQEVAPLRATMIESYGARIAGDNWRPGSSRGAEEDLPPLAAVAKLTL